jgi:hypothetical protein
LATLIPHLLIALGGSAGRKKQRLSRRDLPTTPVAGFPAAWLGDLTCDVVAGAALGIVQ